MYKGSDTIETSFERKSRNGTVHSYSREKTRYHFECDHCGCSFHRMKGDIAAKRVSNDYAHFCSGCHGQSALLGQRSRRKKLDEMIGDRQIDASGYVSIYMGKQHPYSKGYGGRLREHVVVMENHLERPLLSDDQSRRKGEAEVVHHIDGDKTNNDINNLALMTVASHNKCHGEAGSLIFELYKKGIVGFDRETERYYLKD